MIPRMLVGRRAELGRGRDARYWVLNWGVGRP